MNRTDAMNRMVNMLRNSTLIAAALLLSAFSARSAAAAQDVLALGGSVGGMRGTNVVVPVIVLDASGTALGVDQPSASRIQALGLRVTFSPSSSVRGVTFRRAGITAAKTPLYERSMQAQSGAPTGYAMSFAQSTNPLGFTPGSTTGDVIAEMVITLASNAPSGPITMTIDSSSAMLSNQAGTIKETVANGRLLVYGNTVTVYPPKVRSDLNADGRTDIVLQNSSTSAVAVWLMNDNTIIEGKVVTTPGADWQLVATGDLDGDRKADILMRNNSTGALSWWQMNGSARLSATTIAILPAVWRVVGTYDFNHDGRDDLVLQNDSTGDVALWLMSGATAASTAIVATDATSRAVALGNFGGDAIVFESKTDQSLYRSLVVNSAVTTSSPIANATGMNVKSAGDYDGDGDDDLAVQTFDTRTVTVRLLASDGYTVMTSAAVATPVVDWRVVGGGDYDGNGRSDLLLHNSQTNGIAQWQMNGTAIARGWNIATMAGWKPLGN